MKKLISLLLMTVIISGFSACSPKAVKIEYAGSVKPSEFSEETIEVLKIFNDEVDFFDVSLNDGVKSYYIDIYAYSDEKWQNIGGTSGSVKHSPLTQFAIRTDGKSLHFYSFDEKGHVGYTPNDIRTEFTEDMGVGGSKITEKTSLEFNKPYTIWYKIGKKGNEMKLLSPEEGYESLDCDAGLAMTIILSDQELK